MTQTTKHQHRTKNRAALKQAHVVPAKLEELFRDLTPACQAEMRAFYRDENTIASSALGRIWSQGRRVETLKKQEYQRSNDGDRRVNTVEILAQLAGKSVSLLNKWAQLYRAFATEPKRLKLLGYRMRGSGRPLSWAHMEHLLRVHSVEGNNSVFEELLRQTLENDWTPEELDHHMKTNRRLSGKKTRGGGRPTKVPATFHGRVAKLSSQVTAMLKNAKDIYLHREYSFLNAIRNMSQEELSKNSKVLASEVTELREQLRQLVDLVNDQLNVSLDGVLQHVNRATMATVDSNGHQEADRIERADASAT